MMWLVSGVVGMLAGLSHRKEKLLPDIIIVFIIAHPTLPLSITAHTRMEQLLSQQWVLELWIEKATKSWGSLYSFMAMEAALRSGKDSSATITVVAPRLKGQ